LNDKNIKLYDVLKIIEKDEFNQTITIENESGQDIISYQTGKMLFGQKE